ncbi:hypothetical protein [Chamaesiphon sp. VAR_48_metabat_403]|nr:hypothetical protein [Chamaesiphon sp. VAR_48_metabat_403]
MKWQPNLCRLVLAQSNLLDRSSPELICDCIAQTSLPQHFEPRSIV